MTFLHTAISHEGFPLAAGMLAAILHVVTGPDHLAAVIPMAIENKKKSWGVGLGWGLGHLVGMLLIGVVFILARSVVSDDVLESFSSYSEQFVGIVLVFIGVWALLKVRKSKRKHEHPHKHSGEEEEIIHVHAHDHNKEGHHHKHRNLERQNVFASFSVGTLHGFAGITHFILLTPTLAYENKGESILYLGGFGLGTIAAMTVFAFVIGFIAYKSNRDHDDRLFRYMRVTGAVIAIGVGIFWFANASLGNSAHDSHEHQHPHEHKHDHNHSHDHDHDHHHHH